MVSSLSAPRLKIEILKIFDKETKEWKEAMEDLRKALSQVRELMAKISKISALHGEDAGRKQSAEEEITEDFVESLRKRPVLATLNQPSQLSQATSQILQMVDLQALDDLRGDAVASKSNGGSESMNSDMEGPGSENESTEGNDDVAPDYIVSTIATATPGASIDDSGEENDGFPYCGAGKHRRMLNKRLNARCYGWNEEQPKHMCKTCRHLLHGVLCGSWEEKK